MISFEEKTYRRYLPPFPKVPFYGKSWQAWPEYKDANSIHVKRYVIDLRTIAQNGRPYLSLRQALAPDEIAEPHGCAILKLCLRLMEQRFDAALEKHRASL